MDQDLEKLCNVIGAEEITAKDFDDTTRYTTTTFAKWPLIGTEQERLDTLKSRLQARYPDAVVVKTKVVEPKKGDYRKRGYFQLTFELKRDVV